MTKLVILAGGEGSRFFPFTSIIPKCLVPVAGKPCVRRIIEDAISQGFKDIVLCINEKDRAHYAHEFRDLDIQFSVTEVPMDTAGEVLQAQHYLDGAPFIVRYGDDLTEVSYQALVDFHNICDSDVTLVATNQMPLPVGIIEVAPEATLKVTRFIEKPALNRLAWAGIAVFNHNMLAHFHVDIARNTLPAILSDPHSEVYVFRTTSEWYDVGNIEHWRKVDQYFKEKE